MATSAKSGVATTTTATRPSRQRIVQNFLLIWVDGNIDQSSKDCQNTLAQLRGVVNDVNLFTQPDECIQFLKNVNNEKAFVIVSGALGQHLVSGIHEMAQLDAIYIFCGNKSHHEQWAKEWTKVKGVHTDIKPICEALEVAVKQCNQDAIAVSFVTVGKGNSNQNLDQLDPTFMYTQIFKETLLEMEYEDKSKQDLVAYCLEQYAGNLNELNIINEFGRKYQSDRSIWWYTRECFTYQMLNRALRMLEADIIITMGFFIRDLHHQIEQLHQKQVVGYHGEIFTVYRGQGLSITDFERLQKTIGGLMSFNSFLSTSKGREVSFDFAKGAIAKTNMVGILFKMAIDPSISSTPFATIDAVSYFKTEEEVLFSMHTVFRIGEIKKINNNNRLYQVELTFTRDDDEQLRTLTKRIQQEIGGSEWSRLAQLLVKIGQFNKAEELYKILIDQASDEGKKAVYYSQLGSVKDHQGDYEKAIAYHEKALEIKGKTLPLNHPSLATAYGNIAGVYYHMKEYSKALSFYEKDLGIGQKTLPPNHLALATSYNNIGEVYRNMEEYSKALSSYEKALEIREKTLPPNHPNLATLYNNIGLVYDNMGGYSKALSFYEKALEIKGKTLPPNHPSLATSYNNIGAVYKSMGEHTKAISFYERALNIFQNSLPANHPNIKTVQQNIEYIKKKL